MTNSEEGIGNFYTIRPDGTGLKQITHLVNSHTSHRAGFSPDGKWVIVAYVTGGRKNADLFIMHVDGSGARAITSNPLWDTGPDWAPPR